MNLAELPDDPEAPPGQIYVCSACGAVLCYVAKNADGKWVAVLESEANACPEKPPTE
jgi:hypothetical protein